MLHNYMFRPFFRPSAGCNRLALRVIYLDGKVKDIYSRQHNNYMLLKATVLRCKIMYIFNLFKHNGMENIRFNFIHSQAKSIYQYKKVHFNLTSKDCCFKQRIIVVLTAVYIFNLFKHNGMENIRFNLMTKYTTLMMRSQSSYNFSLIMAGVWSV